MTIEYHKNVMVQAQQVADVFDKSGIRRPTSDLQRIQQMLDNANLTITAWDNHQLVGIARALTDFSWCCYLSDLAVDAAYQKQGIGRELVKRVQDEIGEGAALILLSAPEAMEYYPKIGLQKAENAFIIKRKP